MERKTHIIDAAGKVLGRLAVEIARLLRGKDKPDFVPYKNMGDFVVVKNADKMKFTGEKLENKKFYRHSGYPGGLKEVTLGKLLEEKPTEVLRRAVYGMLPLNRLRDKQIQLLKFE